MKKSMKAILGVAVVVFATVIIINISLFSSLRVKKINMPKAKGVAVQQKSQPKTNVDKKFRGRDIEKETPIDQKVLLN